MEAIFALVVAPFFGLIYLIGIKFIINYIKVYKSKSDLYKLIVVLFFILKNRPTLFSGSEGGLREVAMMEKEQRHEYGVGQQSKKHKSLVWLTHFTSFQDTRNQYLITFFYLFCQYSRYNLYD